MRSFLYRFSFALSSFSFFFVSEKRLFLIHVFILYVVYLFFFFSLLWVPTPFIVGYIQVLTRFFFLTELYINCVKRMQYNVYLGSNIHNQSRQYTYFLCEFQYYIIYNFNTNVIKHDIIYINITYLSFTIYNIG